MDQHGLFILEEGADSMDQVVIRVQGVHLQILSLVKQVILAQPISYIQVNLGFTFQSILMEYSMDQVAILVEEVHLQIFFLIKQEVKAQPIINVNLTHVVQAYQFMDS